MPIAKERRLTATNGAEYIEIRSTCRAYDYVGYDQRRRASKLSGHCNLSQASIAIGDPDPVHRTALVRLGHHTP